MTNNNQQNCNHQECASARDLGNTIIAAIMSSNAKPEDIFAVLTIILGSFVAFMANPDKQQECLALTHVTIDSAFADAVNSQHNGSSLSQMVPGNKIPA